MNSKLKQSELDSLEIYRLVLTNVDAHPDIAQHMSEIGYSAEIINEGRKLYDSALDAFNISINDRGERSAAYKAYIKKWNILQEMFTIHRNKAKVIFRKDDLSTAKLGLTSVLPTRYIKLISVIKSFYAAISVNEV